MQRLVRLLLLPALSVLKSLLELTPKELALLCKQHQLPPKLLIALALQTLMEQSLLPPLLHAQPALPVRPHLRMYPTLPKVLAIALKATMEMAKHAQDALNALAILQL